MQQGALDVPRAMLFGEGQDFMRRVLGGRPDGVPPPLPSPFRRGTRHLARRIQAPRPPALTRRRYAMATSLPLRIHVRGPNGERCAVEAVDAMARTAREGLKGAPELP